MGRVDPAIHTVNREEAELLQWFGFTLEEAVDGVAAVTATPGTHQANAHRMVHGGLIFALADHAFAMCATTILGAAATEEASIRYLAPGRVGDVITARATVIAHRSRMAVVDVEVRTGDTLLAVYRGTARSVRTPSSGE